MRIFRKIRVQLVVIVLVCYMLPVLVLGFYVGGAVLRDFKAKTESALTTGMDYSLMLAEEGLQKLVALSRDATYDGELTQALSQRDAGAISGGEFLRLARSYIERKYSREGLLTFAACFTLDNPDLLLVSRTGAEAAERYREKAHGAVLAMTEALDTQCRFVMLEGDVYLVRNLVSLRMKPYGMLVLGVDVDRLAAPLTALAAEWNARLDIALDDVTIDDLTATGALGAEGEGWQALPDGRIVPAGAGQYALVRSGAGRDYALRVGLVLPRVRLYGELGNLGTAFSNMSLRLRDLIEKTYKEEIALRDARVQAMQSRINPHFINNALETINWQARMEGSETISAMVESLSVLLNAGMSRNDRHMLPLREELDTVRAYFYFIGLRFGDRLTTRMDVAPEALECVLPALTLQPLIENAAEHGIAPAGGGEIALRCARRGDALWLEVANSGQAATPQDRQRIDAALQGDSQSGSHLGLANISMRLRLIYDGRASIRVDTDTPGWTRVTLEVPQFTDSSGEGR